MKSNAFTLTELLVVIGLIVLLLVIAIPSMNFIMGTNSIAGAQNQISAMVARARVETMGVERVGGVMFLTDESGRVHMALVREIVAKSPGVNPYPPFSIMPMVSYIDLVPDRDWMILPPGITVQVADNSEFVGAARQDDAYLGYTAIGSGQYRIGGVILFEPNGQLRVGQYGLCLQQNGTPTAISTTFGITGSDMTDLPNNISDFGFVVFQSEPFRNNGGDDADPETTGQAYSASEQAEEDWIDANADVFAIGRYTGTINRGQ